MLTEREVDRRYAQALDDFGRVFSEPHRKPICLLFNTGSVDLQFGYECIGSNTIHFPLSASIAENSIREVIKSWLRDGIVYHGVSRPIAKDPAGS